MRRGHALSIAIAAVLGALAIAALPALAGASDDHGHHAGERHHHHHDGFRDRHHNVGQISAFDPSSGQLTIARFGGGTISGLVTSSTEIKCEGPDDRSNESARFSRDSSNSGPGSSGSGEDHSGRGSGDDNGGRGEEEPGDDHGAGNDNQICTTADLTVGTVVDEVDRDFDNGVVSFDEIELGHTS
jgi:hypothetical protein